MLKIGIESDAYFSIDEYKQGFKKIKSHGYDCVDYSSLANPGCYLYKKTEKEFVDFLKDVRKTAENEGVEISQMHGLWPSNDTTDETRKQGIEYLKKQILAAKELGCPNLVIHPCLPYKTGPEPDNVLGWETNVERLEKILPTAEKFGVNICVENLPFLAIKMSQVDWLKKLLDYFQHPNLKICFDTGHANVYQDDLAEDVRKIGKDLQCLHVHDNRGNWDEHMTPYKGTIDWESFLTALKQIGYKGCFSLETYPNKKMPEPFLENERLNLAKLARFMASQLAEKEVVR